MGRLVNCIPRLPYLKTFLAEAAKFGGCAVLGLQSYAQLGEVCGDKGARVILSLRALVHSTGRWEQFWQKVNQFGLPMAA